MAVLTKATLNNVQFNDCKLLGLHLEHCNKFLLSVSFRNCILDLSCFFRLNLKKTQFINCSLKEADFSATDVSGSIFTGCDLSGAVFDATNLEKADLRSSLNYTIDPEKNKIKKAKFSVHGLAGLLDKYDIVVE